MNTTNNTTEATIINASNDKGTKNMNKTPKMPKGAVCIGSVTILPAGIAAAEKALIAAQLRAIKAATKAANAPVREKKVRVPAAPRVLPTMTVTLQGVNKVLPAYADGPREFAGWTACFVFCTELVRALRAAGHRLQGNYKTGAWTCVVDGQVLSIVAPVPAGKGPRKPKTEAAPSTEVVAA